MMPGKPGSSWLRLILFSILIAGLSLSITSIATGKIYRWVDENGRLHFSDSPRNIPEEKRGASKEYKLNSSSLTITSESGNSPASEKSTSPTKKPAPEGTISIPYTAKEGSANRIIIDISFNGSRPVPIMVDTGSPGLIITSSLASDLGLFDQDGSQLLVLISGIGGRQIAARTIIDKLAIGGITEKFVPAHIVPDMSDAYQGLIGMDILSSYTLTIDSINKRLIAKAVPQVKDLPGGRSQAWWQTTFREFGYYSNLWKDQAELIGKTDSPYYRLATSEVERLKSFIQHQQNESQNLYNRLERYARWQSVPKHWRR